MLRSVQPSAFNRLMTAALLMLCIFVQRIDTLQALLAGAHHAELRDHPGATYGWLYITR